MQNSKDMPLESKNPPQDQDGSEALPSSASGQKRSLDSSTTTTTTTSTCATTENTPQSDAITIAVDPDTQEHKKQKQNAALVIDIAQTVNLQPGARIEVQWDLHFENNDIDSIIPNNNDDNNNEKDQTITTTQQTRWWGGTLLHPDSRTHTLQDSDSKIQDQVTVPIRVIDYDPFPEGGFLERSLEDVCFLSDHSLLNVASDTRACWRKEGEEWEPRLDADEEERVLMGGLPAGLAAANVHGNNAGDASDDDSISVASASKEDALKVVLDSVLLSAMQKSGIMDKMNQLEASQQSFMAAKIAMAKEKLSQKLMEQLNDTSNSNGNGDDSLDNDNAGHVITEEHVAKCVEEFQKGA
jgi:hypothetical protein